MVSEAGVAPAGTRFQGGEPAPDNLAGVQTWNRTTLSGASTRRNDHTCSLHVRGVGFEPDSTGMKVRTPYQEKTARGVLGGNRTRVNGLRIRLPGPLAIRGRTGADVGNRTRAPRLHRKESNLLRMV